MNDEVSSGISLEWDETQIRRISEKKMSEVQKFHETTQGKSAPHGALEGFHGC